MEHAQVWIYLPSLRWLKELIFWASGRLSAPDQGLIEFCLVKSVAALLRLKVPLFKYIVPIQ